MPGKTDWVNMVGPYKFHCLVLADFDPIKAESFFCDLTHDKIAEAVVSKIAYHYQPVKK